LVYRSVGKDLNKLVRLFVGALLPLTGLVFMASTATAAAQPRLGSALNFTVLAGSTITSTGPTVITGNLGLSPGTAVTGFPPGKVTGAMHVADANAGKAKTDLVQAYTDAKNALTTVDMTGKDLGGKNLTPGVYAFSSAAALTGILTLHGGGVYIFKVGSALTVAASSRVLVKGGANACSIWWQVGTSATLLAASNLQGNLMAQDDITLVAGASILDGRALARTGALTLAASHITPPSGACNTSGGGSGGKAKPTPRPSASPSGEERGEHQSESAERKSTPTPTHSLAPKPPVTGVQTPFIPKPPTTGVQTPYLPIAGGLAVVLL
jgi:Ice-binding-like